MDDPAQLDEQMALLADGDRSTIDPLFRALWPVVHAYCRRALGTGADADDAAQQALLTVFSEAGRYDKRRRALPWVITIAVWECRSARRRRQRARTTSLDAAENATSAAVTPEEAVVERDLLAGALEVFELLPASDRAVLRLAFEQEIETVPAISGATLRKRRQRALGRLRDAWDRRPLLVLSLNGLLFATAVFLLWRGQQAGKGMLAGLAAGAIPLLSGVCLQGYQLVCGASVMMPGCFAVCSAGDFLAGGYIAWTAQRRGGTSAFVLSAGTVALLMGSLGCMCAGIGGVVGLFGGLAVPIIVRQLQTTQPEV